MAKIRVYELAKELEMDNKVLMDTLREMNIEVKSHSSSLSEEEVSLIKGHLSGTKSLVVEEQRIKSTVIRRRRKIVEVAPEPVAEPPAEIRRRKFFLKLRNPRALPHRFWKRLPPRRRPPKSSR